MTAPETVHLYALIALRALADYDQYEFQRSTDLSKGEVDQRIERLIESLRYAGDDERRLADVRQKLEDLRALQATAESPATLSYLLRQVENSSLQRAYQLALNMSHSGELEKYSTRHSPDRQVKSAQARDRRDEPDFLRLGVMRLLRDLPYYEPKFGHRVRNMDVDCFLEPTVAGYPPVLIEAKASLRSTAGVNSAVNQLKRLSAGWGKEVVTVLLTPPVSEDVRAHWNRTRGKYLLLAFDTEANEFEPRDFEGVVSAVNSHAPA